MNQKVIILLACAPMGMLLNTNAAETTEPKENGEVATVLGKGAVASGEKSTSIGVNSKATGNYSAALGALAEAADEGSISLVFANSKEINELSSALGFDSEASGEESTSIGVNSKATGNYSAALGALAEAADEGSISLVFANSKEINELSSALGFDSEASGEESTSIGVNSKATNKFSSALGFNSEASGEKSTSIGVNSKATGNYSAALGAIAEASGEKSTSIGVNSKAAGKDSIAVGSKSIAQREYTKSLTDTLIKQLPYKGALIREFSMGSIVKDSTAGTNVILSQITHVVPGTEDTDAVNLYQLNRVKRDVDERIGTVDKIKTTKNNVERFENEARIVSETTTQHHNNAKNALDATVKHRDNAKSAFEKTTQHRDNAYDALTRVKMHENSADLIVKRLKREASPVEGEITQSSDGTMYMGKELKGSQIFVSGKQGDRVISGLASGVRNSDAVNVSQLNTVRTTANYASRLAQKNSSQINHLVDRLSKINTKIERGLSASAALTGLFQPYGVGKVNFTASIGGYGVSQALAVGTGYRITENCAVKAGVAYSGGNNVMYNASFNFEW